MDFDKLSLFCTFLFLNVKGTREKNKISQIFTKCKDKYADIVLLEETNSTPDIEDTWILIWD